MKILVILSLNFILFFNAFANTPDSIQFNFVKSLTTKEKYKVGLLVMATGRYINFVPPLIESAQKYFCTNHDVTYFVFTDDKNFKHEKTIRIYQEKLNWPFATMMRYHTYLKNKNIFAHMDYLFATDADMLFVGRVGDEILSERVATLHPGYYGWKKHKQPFPYETNQISTAYINPAHNDYYFAGGFYGGTTKEIINLLETNVKNVDTDLKKNHIAVWHDESHNNKYFNENKPTKILTPDYCFPEDATKPELKSSYELILNLSPKLIALARRATKEEIDLNNIIHLNELSDAQLAIEKNLLASNTLISTKSKLAIAYLLNNGFEIVQNGDTVILKRRS